MTWKHKICVIVLSTVFIGRCVVLSQNLSYVPDDVVLKTVKEYLSMCPDNDICGTNVTHSRRRGLCCSHCSCADTCGTSCCPDKPTSYLTDGEILNIKQDPMRCIRLQYKYVTENSTLKNNAYNTIVQCPTSYEDDVIKSKCIKGYEDIELLEVLNDFVPVSNATTVFKNKYCAICHGTAIQSLEFWDIQVICQEPAEYPVVNNLMEVKKAVDATVKCDFFFVPVHLTHRDKLCGTSIDRCNMTGNWQQYDADLERACLSYKSTYDIYYKNVHCFLCNKQPEDQVKTTCDTQSGGFHPNSFVALLDFQGLQIIQDKPSSIEMVKCPLDYVYDVLQGACRLLLCPDYMYVDGDTCVPLFNNFRITTVFDIVITLEPRDYVQNYPLFSASIETIYNALWYYLSSSLATIQGNFSACQIFGVIALRKTITQLIGNFIAEDRKNLMFSEIEYFAFRIQINTDSMKELQNLNGLFSNASQWPDLMHYIMRFRNVPLDLFGAALEEPNAHSNGGRDLLLDTLMLDTILLNALSKCFKYGISVLTIAPLYLHTDKRCISVAQFQVNPSCPKVHLRTDEFTIQHDGVLINSTNMFLSNNNIIFTQNNSLLVCYRHYLSSLTNQYTLQQQNTDSSTMKPIMILTIIALSCSLTSLAVTFVIYILFEQLKTLPGLNILGLVISLFVTHLLTLINGIIYIRLGTLCAVFGAVLHFSLMMSIFWMFVCTYHMAKVFVKMTTVNPKLTNKWHSFIRYVVFTLCMSSLCVVINMTASSVRSKGRTYGYDDTVCYIESTDMIILTVAVPTGCVVLANMVMFACVVFKVGRVPAMDLHKTNDRKNITIFVKISTLTGMTWGFGFLYQFTKTEAFSYIFVILNASQGVFIMIAFVMNQRVSRMLKTHFSHEASASTTRTSDKQTRLS